MLRLCDAAGDSRTLRLELLDAIRRVVGFDAYAWLVTDPETSVGWAPLADVPCLPRAARLIRLKYLTTVNRWTTLPAQSAADRGDRRRPVRAAGCGVTCCADYAVATSPRSVYRDRYGCWGFLDLWRSGRRRSRRPTPRSSTPSPAPVTAALRRSQAAYVHGRPAAQRPPGPVVLLLSPELEVAGTDPGDPAGTCGAGAAADAAVPRSRPAPTTWRRSCWPPRRAWTRNPPLARVHLSHGRWLTLRAARIGSAGGPQDRDIAVSIEEASPRRAPGAVRPRLRPERARGGTAASARRGSDTRELARQMFLSEHTVQDHLKSIFAKTRCAAAAHCSPGRWEHETPQEITAGRRAAPAPFTGRGHGEGTGPVWSLVQARCGMQGDRVHTEIEAASDELVTSGAETGLQVAVVKDGQLVGRRRGVAPPDRRGRLGGALFYAASTAKGVAATVAHVLVERGELGYDMRAVDVWPEFGSHGKDKVTLRHVLLHTAGVPRPPAGHHASELCDWDHMCAVLAGAEPWWEPVPGLVPRADLRVPAGRDRSAGDRADHLGAPARPGHRPARRRGRSLLRGTAAAAAARRPAGGARRAGATLPRARVAPAQGDAPRGRAQR